MSLNDKERRFGLKIKKLLSEGRLFNVETAVGISMILKTDEEMDSMEKFLDAHPQATHDEILEYMLKLKNR